MKRVAAILFIACLICLNSVSCGKKQDSALKIGVIMGNMADTFIKYIHDDVVAYKKEIGDSVELLIKDARGDAAYQQSLVENLVTQNVDGIMLQLVNPETAVAVDKIAKDAKIPILYFNHQPKGLPEGGYSFVGLDEYFAGKVQAETALKVKTKGNAVILIGPLGTEAAEMRTKSVKDILQGSDVKVVREQSANWYREEALRIIENCITGGLVIDFVFANNDDMAIGAVQALEASGKKFGSAEGQTLVFGIDATPDGMKYLEDGKIYATVKQDTKVQARSALDAMIDLIKTGESKINWLSPALVMKE